MVNAVAVTRFTDIWDKGKAAPTTTAVTPPPAGSQGTPLPAGRQGTPLPPGSEGTPVAPTTTTVVPAP